MEHISNYEWHKHATSIDRVAKDDWELVTHSQTAVNSPHSFLVQVAEVLSCDKPSEQQVKVGFYKENYNDSSVGLFNFHIVQHFPDTVRVGFERFKDLVCHLRRNENNNEQYHGAQHRDHVPVFNADPRKDWRVILRTNFVKLPYWKNFLHYVNWNWVERANQDQDVEVKAHLAWWVDNQQRQVNEIDLTVYQGKEELKFCWENPGKQELHDHH